MIFISLRNDRYLVESFYKLYLIDYQTNIFCRLGCLFIISDSMRV